MSLSKKSTEVAADAVVGAIAVGATLLVLALLGIDPNEVLVRLRMLPLADRLVFVALLLSLVLLGSGIIRVVRERRAGQDVALPTAAVAAPIGELRPSPSVAKHGKAAVAEERVPRNKHGKVKVRYWIPGVGTVEHGGALWTTLMSPISDAEMISATVAPPDPDDIDAKYPPLCPDCRTDLDERVTHGTTLEERLAGPVIEMFCVNCGWKHNAGEGMQVLHGQAQKKARGMVRRLLEGGTG